MKHCKRLYLFLSFGLCLCILAAVALAMPENTSDDDASRDASLSDVLFSSENAAEQILSEEAKEVPLLAAFFARMPFTAEEQSYLTELAKSGYPTSRIMTVADFWLDTDEPLSLIEELLAGLSEYEEVYTGAVEDVYNGMTDCRGGVLTYEEVCKLAEEGVPIADIYTANTLSRKGVYDIHSILDRAQNDGSFAPVAQEIFTEAKRDRIDFSDEATKALYEESGGNILLAARLSRMTGASMAEIAAKEQSAAELWENEVSARTRAVQPFLPVRDAEEADEEVTEA